MTRYSVNVRLDVPAWFYVEADSPEEAIDEARNMSASDFEHDMSAAYVDFADVTADEEQL